MNTQEEYDSLYQRMATSGKPEYMKVFGSVMNDMMGWMIANKPDLAKEWVDRLQSIKWDNYLTESEAESIVSKMKPSAPWSRETWRSAMQSIGIPTEEKPFYNPCAMWVVMNMVYSDHGHSIADIAGKPLSEMPTEAIVRAVHSMAEDLLCDEDRRFNVRRYFDV